MSISPVTRWIGTAVAVSLLASTAACSDDAVLAESVTAQFREVAQGPLPDESGQKQAPEATSGEVTRDEVHAQLGADLVADAQSYVTAAEAAVEDGQPVTAETLRPLLDTSGADFSAFGDLSARQLAVLPAQWPFFLPAIGCPQIDALRKAEAAEDQQVTACQNGKDGPVKYLLAPAKLDNGDVESAEASASPTGDGFLVTITFTEAGAKKWRKLTAATVNRNVAIVTDGEVISAPTIMGEIPNGVAEVTGRFTREEAEKLAAGIEAGSKPVD